MTSEGVLVGTLGYMAPEQARGRSVDARTDVFAVGIVAYEALAGKQPFLTDDPVEVLRRISAAEVEDFGEIRSDLGDALPQVVMRALARDPKERFSDARDLRDALRDARVSVPAAGLAASLPAREAIAFDPDSLGMGHLAKRRSAELVERGPQRTWLIVALVFSLAVVALGLTAALGSSDGAGDESSDAPDPDPIDPVVEQSAAPESANVDAIAGLPDRVPTPPTEADRGEEAIGSETGPVEQGRPSGPRHVGQPMSPPPDPGGGGNDVESTQPGDLIRDLGF